MSFFEELTKKATGLLSDIRSNTSSGSGGDMFGEAAMPSTIGQQTSSLISSVPMKRNVGGQIQTVPVNQALNPQYQNFGVSPNMGTPQFPFQKQTNKSARGDGAETDLDKIAANPSLFENIFKMTPNDAKAMWKDKGGFEGLMSNPAFSLGLGIMQSASRGEPISQSMLDNALKAGAISDQYAKRIQERSKVLGPVSEDQREEVRSVLAESDIFEGSLGQKFKNFFKGKNTAALNRRALDDIYNEAYKIAKKKASGGKEVRVDRDIIEQAVKSLKASGKLDISDKGITSMFFGRGIQSKAPGLAKGGPVKADKQYVVGEEGPEMFVPQVDGNIINNDDAKVVNMLLESNPQLKSISRARAVKILKNRFPDYF
jgi:hypothetical protein